MPKISLFAFFPLVIAGVLATSALALSPIQPVRQKIGIVTTELAKQGYRLLPGETYKAVHEKMSLAIIAPAGPYAAVAVPEDGCENAAMAIEDRKAGKRYAAKPLGDALIAEFTPEKDTEVFLTMQTSDDRCFAYLLGYGR